MELEEMLKKLKEELRKNLESKIAKDMETEVEEETKKEKCYIRVNEEGIDVYGNDCELLTLLTMTIRSLKEDTNISDNMIKTAVELGLAEDTEAMMKKTLETVLKGLKDALNK